MNESPHQHSPHPSQWVVRFAPLIPAQGRVLDVASGGGRHARYLASLGYRVEAVDRDRGLLAALAGDAGVRVRIADLESGAWPFMSEKFDGIVVVNYLHRPLFPHLLAALSEPGVLIYETFARGNEKFGKPSNPDYLLEPGELLEVVRGKLQVIAYEDLLVSDPRPAKIQRICAAKFV